MFDFRDARGAAIRAGQNTGLPTRSRWNACVQGRGLCDADQLPDREALQGRLRLTPTPRHIDAMIDQPAAAVLAILPWTKWRAA
jgi:hypothetical protein